MRKLEATAHHQKNLPASWSQTRHLYTVCVFPPPVEVEPYSVDAPRTHDLTFAQNITRLSGTARGAFVIDKVKSFGTGRPTYRHSTLALLRQIERSHRETGAGALLQHCVSSEGMRG